MGRSCTSNAPLPGFGAWDRPSALHRDQWGGSIPWILGWIEDRAGRIPLGRSESGVVVGLPRPRPEGAGRLKRKKMDGMNRPDEIDTLRVGGNRSKHGDMGVPLRIGIGIDVGRQCLLVRLGWISRVPDIRPPSHRSMERGTAMEGKAMDNMQPAGNLIEKKMV